MRLRALHAGPAPGPILLAVLLVGCGQEPGVDFQPRTTPPLDTTLTQDAIRIYAGIAVELDAIPLSGGEQADESTVVSMSSTDVNVIGVDPATANGVFVIYGVSPGTADVRVFMDSDPVGAIPATVLDQGNLP